MFVTAFGTKKFCDLFSLYIIAVDKRSAEREITKMEKQTIKTANKIVYVGHWLLLNGDDSQKDGVTASQMPNGRWVCEIEIPLVNQMVKATSSSEINAMLNASEKAYLLIKKYLNEHPEVKFFKMTDFRHYEISIDENGYAMIQTNSEYRKKRGDEIVRMQVDVAKAMERAVAKIKKVNGTDKNLFVQVIDKSFFKEDDTIKDMENKIADRLLNGNANWFVSWQSTTIVGNCVVAIGHIMEMD